MERPDPSKKRPLQHRPKGKLSPDIVIGKRDLEILKLVYKHRFLDTQLLLHLLHTTASGSSVEYRTGSDGKKRPSRYGFGEKALYKRLLVLVRSGHLDRKKLYDEPFGEGMSSPRAVYGLGSKSAGVLSQAIGASPAEIKDMVQANKVKTPFLRHALETARFRVILELACQRSDGRIRLTFWEQGNDLSDSIAGLDEQGYEERYPVRPDAFFGLSVSGRGRSHFFLEWDRGTMPIVASGDRSDIRKKILGYWHYRKSGKYKKRYFVSDRADAEVSGLYINRPDRNSIPQLTVLEPIVGYTVLFIAPGRVEESGVVSGRLANILTALAGLKKIHAGTSLFWFSSPDRFSLSEPESVFHRAWITGNPDLGLQSLIE